MKQHNTAELIYPIDTSMHTSTDDPVKQTKRAGRPILNPLVQMKWGLTLLGEEKAAQYLNWIQRRLHPHDG